MKKTILRSFFLLLFFNTGAGALELSDLAKLALENSLDYRAEWLEYRIELNQNELERLKYKLIPKFTHNYQKGIVYEQVYSADTTADESGTEVEEARRKFSRGYQKATAAEDFSLSSYGYVNTRTEKENYDSTLSFGHSYLNGNKLDFTAVSSAVSADGYTSKYLNTYGVNLTVPIAGAQHSLDYLNLMSIQETKLLKAENALLQSMLEKLCAISLNYAEQKITENSLARYQKLETEYSGKYKARLLSESEYLTTKLTRDESAKELQKATCELEASYLDFGVLFEKPTRLSSAEVDTLVGKLIKIAEKIPEPTLAGIKQSLLENNPDRLTASEELKKGELDLKNLTRKLGGNLDLVLNGQKRGEGESMRDSRVFDGKSWLVGVTYDVPLDRKSLKLEIKNQQLAIEKLKNSLLLLDRQDYLSAMTYQKDYRSKKMDCEISDIAMRRSAIQLKEADKNFKKGEISLDEYLDYLSTYQGSEVTNSSNLINFALYKFTLFGLGHESILKLF
ncbi:MAG: TolC family protein [Candidatus Wallbacteria bacterium]|nr:TolC family protein [Candidatus Wallbacteria bacterium]